MHNAREHGEPQPKKEEVIPMLEEARMVLPGIQALYGFQLVAVLSSGFEHLSHNHRLMHFLSLLANVTAIALIMAPAAYHRLAEEWSASARFMRISSRLIAWAMIALMIALATEVVLIGDVLFESWLIDWALGTALISLLGGLWFLWPLASRRGARKYD